MDVFVEQLVKKEMDGLTILRRVGIIVAALLLSFIAVMFSGLLGPLQTFGMLIAVGILYGGWYLLGLTRIEFEYINTNGEIDIDKIISQRKRVRLCTFKGSTVEKTGRYNLDEHKNKGYGRVLKSCANEKDSKNTWYATYRDSKHGLTLVLFTPSAKFLESYKKSLPRPMQIDVQLWN